MYKIKDKADYANTKKLMKEFESDISSLETLPLNGTHPMLRKADIESRQSQVEDFKQQLRTYEKRKNANT